MGVRIKLSFTALRLGKTSFWRCGVEHSRDGAVYAEDQFTPAEWDRLRSDPMLDVTEVPDDAAPAPTPEEAATALRAQVRSAIEALSWDEYTKGGKPQLGAVRDTASLADYSALSDLVASVWSEMTAEGFVAPSAPEPVPPAGAVQDDAGAPEEA